MEITSVTDGLIWFSIWMFTAWLGMYLGCYLPYKKEIKDDKNNG